MERLELRVVNMACEGCAKRLERVLRKKGVSDVRVDLKTKTVEIYYSPENISEEEIRATIKNSGFVVE